MNLELKIVPIVEKPSSVQINSNSPKYPSSSHTVLIRDAKIHPPTSSISLTKQQTYRSQLPRSTQSTGIGEANSLLFKRGSSQSRGGFSSQSEEKNHNQLSLNLSPNHQNQINSRNIQDVEDYNLPDSKATTVTPAFPKSSLNRISPTQSPKTIQNNSSPQLSPPFSLKPSRVETTNIVNPTPTTNNNNNNNNSIQQNNQSSSLTNIEPIPSTINSNFQTSFNLLNTNFQEKTIFHNSPQTNRTQENGSLSHIPNIDNDLASGSDESQNKPFSSTPSLILPDQLALPTITTTAAAAATATLATPLQPPTQQSSNSLTSLPDQQNHCPSIRITTSEQVIPSEINESEPEQQHFEDNNLMKIPLRFLAMKKFNKPYQIIHEQPGEENGSIMGMSSHIPESPLDMNPDKNRMLMLSSFLNTPNSRSIVNRKYSESIAENELDASQVKQKSLGIIEDEKTPNGLSPFSITESLSVVSPSLNVINEEPIQEESKASPLRRSQNQVLKKSRFSDSKTSLD